MKIGDTVGFRVGLDRAVRYGTLRRVESGMATIAGAVAELKRKMQGRGS